MNNPIFFLAKKMWQFSVGNHRQVVLYFCLFIAANTISLMEPILVAKILNTVQEQGIASTHSPTFYILVSLFILQTVTFWAFHGPARVMEECNSFLVRA
ncbi:MAG: hypothetical protein Q8O46_02755, partial [bacterium]|nr:hypothetical protein [bacterium]